MCAKTEAVTSVDRLIFLAWGRLRATAPNSFIGTKSVINGPGTWTKLIDGVMTQGAFWARSVVLVTLDRRATRDWNDVLVTELTIRYETVRKQLQMR